MCKSSWEKRYYRRTIEFHEYFSIGTPLLEPESVQEGEEWKISIVETMIPKIFVIYGSSRS